MNRPVSLPPLLDAAREKLLEGVSRRELTAQAAALSARYRRSAGSHARRDEVLAYAVTRMPATYAAVCAVLDELTVRMPGITPRSLLDLGSGPGTAAWAASDRFESLSQITCVEREPAFQDLARTLAAEHPILSMMTVRNADLEAPGDSAEQFDLVSAAFVLAEIAPQRQTAVVTSAFRRAGCLILIEPGTPEGSARVRAARDAILAEGGHLIAPCPHAAACPVQSPDWCHFAIRLPRGRDHRLAKGADAPFEDEKFSYLIAAHAPAEDPAAARILRPPLRNKTGTSAILCRDGIIDEMRIPARDKIRFKTSAKWRWGDGF